MTNQPRPSQFNAVASGSGFTTAFIVIFETRDPNSSDIQYPVQQRWINTGTSNEWILIGFISTGGYIQANWLNLNVGVAGIVELTGNSGGPVASDSNQNINIVGDETTINIAGNPVNNTMTVTAGVNGFPVTPFVVGSVGVAGYQTIQSAIDAAHAIGSGVVVVQPGTYTENLTLYSGINVMGLNFADAGGGVTINGAHTPPTSGGFVFRNVALANATSIFSSSSAGSAHLVIADALITITNGYTFNLPNWTGKLESFDVNAAVGTADGYINNTGGSAVAIFECSVGSGTANPMITTGSVTGAGANIYCPVQFRTGSTVAFDYSDFFATVTFSNNSTGELSSTRISTGANAAVTMSSSGNWTLTDCTISSSNNPAIAGSGAGTLTLGMITYTSNSVVANTLTVAYLPLLVPYGGTGASTLTGLLVGNGTSAITGLGDATNGQIPIGSTGVDPVLAVITSTGSTISVTNAPGSISLDINSISGLWTPTLVGGTTSGSTTYLSQTGNYLKLGVFIYIDCILQTSSCTGTGDVRIEGFPFTFASYSSGATQWGGNWTWPTDTTSISIEGTAGSTYAIVKCSGNNVSSAANMQMQNQTLSVAFSMVYQATS
jgi:hypothetical protein